MARRIARLSQFCDNVDLVVVAAKYHANRKSTLTKKRIRKTSDAIEITERELGLKPISKRERAALAENARIAMEIYDMRTKAGLTQTELAKRIGTTPSVFSRLEDVEYGGHSLSMLRRMAWALGRDVEIRFPRVKSRDTLFAEIDAEAARKKGSAGPFSRKETYKERLARFR